ncbi:MAG TPA: alanine racemase, partial [Flavitalea sp.]|nr:alanine racemase [Flavitalea sp.]
MEWYETADIGKIESPALLLYRTRIQQNIDTALSLIGDAGNLRPHIKTNKINEVCQMMMLSGIQKFKCATIAEAEVLGLVKAKDVLLAYQPVGPKVNRFLNVITNYPATHFSCLIDNFESAEQISSIFNEAGLIANVWIDINTGMNRTGVDAGSAKDLLDQLLLLPGIFVKGLHLYDGHITNTNFDIRSQQADKGFKKIEKVQAYYSQITGRSASIVAGGSPTFRAHIKRNVECSPGTFVFWDMGYKKNFPDEPFQC